MSDHSSLREVGPLFGYRAWTVHEGLLYSPRRPFKAKWLAWPTEYPLRATCFKNFFIVSRPHQPPQPGCTCGIYAWKRPYPLPTKPETPTLRAHLGYDLFGVIALEGKTVIQRDGYRTQSARPVAIVAGPGSDEVAKNYRAVVIGSLEEW